MVMALSGLDFIRNREISFTRQKINGFAEFHIPKGGQTEGFYVKWNRVFPFGQWNLQGFSTQQPPLACRLHHILVQNKKG